MSKKVVFLIGNLNGPKYWEPYEKMEDELTAEGVIPLSPSRLPYNLTEEKKMQLQFAMINAADAVILVPDKHFCVMGQVMLSYSKALGKPLVTLSKLDDLRGDLV